MRARATGHSGVHGPSGLTIATPTCTREERDMFKDVKAFSGFSVDDLAAAKEFYGQTLGLELEESGPGLMLRIAGGNGVLVYPKTTTRRRPTPSSTSRLTISSVRSMD